MTPACAHAGRSRWVVAAVVSNRIPFRPTQDVPSHQLGSRLCRPTAKIGSTGVKRFVSIIAIAAAAGVAALIVVRHAIPVDTISEAVKAEIGAATGLDPNLRGPVSMSVFPARMVSFSDVVLGDPAAKD